MSRYVVRVIGPSGRQTYLVRGRETESLEVATHYPHPSNAQVAADGFLQKTPRVFAEVLDTRDPEAVVVVREGRGRPSSPAAPSVVVSLATEVNAK